MCLTGCILCQLSANGCIRWVHIPLRINTQTGWSDSGESGIVPEPVAGVCTVPECVYRLGWARITMLYSHGKMRSWQDKFWMCLEFIVCERWHGLWRHSNKETDDDTALKHMISYSKVHVFTAQGWERVSHSVFVSYVGFLQPCQIKHKKYTWDDGVKARYLKTQVPFCPVVMTALSAATVRLLVLLSIQIYVYLIKQSFICIQKYNSF